MDQLINSLSTGGDDGLGLNIVYEKKDGIEKAAAALKKPKKRNKYEKRRERVRRAKEKKERQEGNINDKSDSQRVPLNASDDRDDDDSKKDVISADGDDNQNECSQEAIINKESAISTKEQNDMTETSGDDSGSIEKRSPSDSKENIVQTDSKKNDVSSEIPEKKHKVVKKQSAFTDSWPELQTEGFSRSKHSLTTADLDDEKRRAEYLASYHARPHEIDRRSGAVSTIKPSHASTHIFSSVTPNDGNETKTPGNESTNDSSNSCPWERLGIHQRLVRTITNSFKLERPTIIQTNAVKSMMTNSNSNHNLFIQSETGSGKTLAYLLPIVQSLAIDAKTNSIKKVDRSLGGTRAIILCPTRELASQTASMAEKLIQNSFSWLVAGCLSGGEKRKSEKARLRKGVSVLIATPGRLLDHLGKTDSLLLSLKGKLEWFVLDEADRLLDMGLSSQVEQIVQMIRANQPKSGKLRNGITWRSFLVSATVTEKVEGLAKKILGGTTWIWSRAKPITQTPSNSNINISSNSTKITGDENDNDGTEESTQKQIDLLGDSTPQQLAQLHMVVSAKLRLPALISFLAARVQKQEDTVVFMSTCDCVDFHYALFQAMESIIPNNDNDREDIGSKHIFGNQCSIHKLHGNIPHAQRQTILTKFAETASITKTKNKKATILLATDVAARGLNLPGVDWIVQYDPPCETADYIHRAGRAARAGNAGHALLFLLPSERQYIEVLKLRGLNNLTALSLAETLRSGANICTEVTAEGEKRSGGGLSANREGEAFTSAIQIRLEECIIQDDKNYKDALAKKTAQSNVNSTRVQKRKERRKAKNATGALLEAARDAFSSYIRAYPTKEKAVKHIFSARALHLGHVARSFALKEPPASVSKTQRSKNETDNGDEDWLKSTGKKRSAQLAFGKTMSSKKIENSNEHTEKQISIERENKNTKRKRNKVKKDSSKSTADNFVSFMEGSSHDSDRFKKQRNFQSMSDIDGNNSHPSSIHEKMMAAARRMQGNGMEFF